MFFRAQNFGQFGSNPVLSRREQALMWQPLPPLEEESVSDSFGGITISGLNTTIAHLMI